MKTDTYQIIKTNTDETKNQNIKKVEVLFDLTGKEYKILDTDFCKKIICVCDSCNLLIEKDGEKDVISLNKPDIAIKLSKGSSVKLKNYTNNTRIIVEYYGENNEL